MVRRTIITASTKTKDSSTSTGTVTTGRRQRRRTVTSSFKSAMSIELTDHSQQESTVLHEPSLPSSSSSSSSSSSLPETEASSAPISTRKTISVMNSPLYFTIRFPRSILIITCFLASVSILFLAETTYKNQTQQEAEAAGLAAAIQTKGDYVVSSSSSSNNSLRNKDNGINKNDSDNGTDIDINDIQSREVRMSLPYGSGNDKKSLSYYHCGPTITSSSLSSSSSKDIEILLLHGAAFTKENYMESNILQNLCTKGNKNISHTGRMSVTALDLSVQADGQGLKSAFDALVQENVLSGKPVVVVSPSASGKSIVSMVSSSSSSSSLLKDVVKVWMPVASSAVLKVKKDDEFKIFTKLNIPILAMNGDQDEMGQRVTKKLVDVANAKGVSMKGGHPCYLDSPIVFVDVILSFLHELQKQ